MREHTPDVFRFPLPVGRHIVHSTPSPASASSKANMRHPPAWDYYFIPRTDSELGVMDGWKNIPFCKVHNSSIYPLMPACHGCATWEQLLTLNKKKMMIGMVPTTVHLYCRLQVIYLSENRPE